MTMYLETGDRSKRSIYKVRLFLKKFNLKKLLIIIRIFTSKVSNNIKIRLQVYFH